MLSKEPSQRNFSAVAEVPEERQRRANTPTILHENKILYCPETNVRLRTWSFKDKPTCQSYQ
jgi:hypothetical protein